MSDNEFGQLLDYLVKTKSGNDTKTTRPKEESSKLTIEDFREAPKELRSKSVGFDSNKFRKLVRDKQIKSFYDKQQYEKPHTSVTELLNCVRYNYYYRSKFPVNDDKNFKFPYLELYADMGIYIHELVQDIYDFTEVKKPLYSKKYKVKGEVDALKPPFLYEFKTVDKSKLTQEFRDKDYFQGNIYSYILNNEYGYDIKYITLVYFFRDDLKSDPYAIDLKYDPVVAEKYLERSIVLLESLDSNIVPDKIGSSKESCYFCVYKEICDTAAQSIIKPSILIEEKLVKELPNKKEERNTKKSKIPFKL